MDIAYEACAITGIVLGLLAGALFSTNHRDAALWVTYTAIILAITGGFIYWQDCLWDADLVGAAKEGRQPLRFFSTTSHADRPTGETIAGIPWHPAYRECRTVIVNDAGIAATNIDLTIRADQLVTAAGDTANSAGTWLGFHDMPSVSLESVNPNTGKRTAIPATPLASARGIRFTCQSLLAKSRIEVVLASVAMRPPSAEPYKGHPIQGVYEKDYWLCFNQNDGKHVYFGGPNSQIDSVFSTPPTVSKIEIAGTYRLGDDQVTVSETIAPIDFVRDAMPELKRVANG